MVQKQYIDAALKSDIGVDQPLCCFINENPASGDKGQDYPTAVDSATLVSPHMEVYWDDISMGKNELAHDMYQIFEKYERN